MTVLFAQIDTIVLTGIAVIVVVLLFRIIGVYNRLTILRNRYKNAYSQIDAQLKRRYDLIPNLVETVKGYMGHERATLEAVINARNVAVVANRVASANPGDPNVMRSLSSAETELAVPSRAVRPFRNLSRPQGESNHNEPSEGADLHREQDCLCPPGLQ